MRALILIGAVFLSLAAYAGASAQIPTPTPSPPPPTGGLTVTPGQVDVGKTAVISVNCNALDLISITGSVGYFVPGSGINGNVGGGARAIYCDGGEPRVKTMSATFLCVNEGYATFTYGAETAVLSCGHSLNLPPGVTPTAEPPSEAPVTEVEAGSSGARPSVPTGTLRAPSTGDGGLLGN